MKYILIPALALALAGCTTIQTGADKAGAYMCANADSLRLSYLVMQQNALLIENVIVRDSVMFTAQAALTALDNCPPAAPPVQPAG